MLVGEHRDTAPVIAEFLGGASATREFLDRWRAPGELRTRAWEDCFGEQRYAALAAEAWTAGLKDASLELDQVSTVAIVGPKARAGAGLAKQLGAAGVDVIDALTATVGYTGAAHPTLLLASLLEQAEPGQVIGLVAMADGADVFLFRVTDAITAQRAAGATVPVAVQLTDGDDTLPVLEVPRLARRAAGAAAEPPRAPLACPPRPPSAAWTGSTASSAPSDRESGRCTCRPPSVALVSGNTDDMDPAPMADVTGHGRDVHRRQARLLAERRRSCSRSSTSTAAAGCRSSSPTSTPTDVAIGERVEMTFRRLITADEIPNYFWKARP